MTDIFRQSISSLIGKGILFPEADVSVLYLTVERNRSEIWVASREVFDDAKIKARGGVVFENFSRKGSEGHVYLVVELPDCHCSRQTIPPIEETNPRMAAAIRRMPLLMDARRQRQHHAHGEVVFGPVDSLGDLPTKETVNATKPWVVIAMHWLQHGGAELLAVWMCRYFKLKGYNLFGHKSGEWAYHFFHGYPTVLVGF